MIRPGSLEEARGAEGEYRAGGTDVHARRRLGASTGELVDLRAVPGLGGIRVEGDGIRIGSMTRITALAAAAEVTNRYPGLALAAGSLATPQVRAVATVGGNLLQRNRCPYFRHPAFACHKSGGTACPAREGDHRHGVIFDLGPCISPHPSTLGMALIAYEASARLGDGRRIPVGRLLGDGTDGRRDHQLPPGEVLVAIDLPAPWDGEVAAYRRATGRALAEWPIVETVCRLMLTGDRIERAAVAVGGVAPVPLRRPEVEEALRGLAVDDISRQSEAARLVAVGARPLPMTGHKVVLLQNTLLDAIQASIHGTAASELAVGERPLPAMTERM